MPYFSLCGNFELVLPYSIVISSFIRAIFQFPFSKGTNLSNIPMVRVTNPLLSWSRLSRSLTLERAWWRFYSDTSRDLRRKELNIWPLEARQALHLFFSLNNQFLTNLVNLWTCCFRLFYHLEHATRTDWVQLFALGKPPFFVWWEPLNYIALLLMQGSEFSALVPTLPHVCGTLVTYSWQLGQNVMAINIRFWRDTAMCYSSCMDGLLSFFLLPPCHPLFHPMVRNGWKTHFNEASSRVAT